MADPKDTLAKMTAELTAEYVKAMPDELKQHALQTTSTELQAMTTMVVASAAMPITSAFKAALARCGKCNGAAMGPDEQRAHQDACPDCHDALHMLDNCAKEMFAFNAFLTIATGPGSLLAQESALNTQANAPSTERVQ